MVEGRLICAVTDEYEEKRDILYEEMGDRYGSAYQYLDPEEYYWTDIDNLHEIKNDR